MVGNIFLITIGTILSIAIGFIGSWVIDLVYFRNR